MCQPRIVSRGVAFGGLSLSLQPLSFGGRQECPESHRPSLPARRMRGLMSLLGLGCVKTSVREERAELFSLLSSPDSGRHCFLVFQIDEVETKFLSANSISEFSHSLGHQRRFE